MVKLHAILVGATMLAPAAAQSVNPNPTDVATQRAGTLLKQMTTAEKVGQLSQFFLFPQPVDLPGVPHDPISYEDHVRRGEVGSFLFVTDPARINQLQKIAVTETRLKIPILFGFDVIHGFDTEFPVPIGMAASWDPELAEQVQAAAAEEATHAGVRWSFAPMLDIARDPRWGRVSEGAGEDPYLGAAMARAQVLGFQGRPGQTTHRPFLATAKHFAGYGAPEGGRDYDASYIPEEQLRNVYLPPFQAAIDAGAATVMSAYMDLNDVPATGNEWLLRDILRNDMHFQGWIVSDAFAVADLATHGYAKDSADAASRAATAGVNMDMGSGTYLRNLVAQVDKGDISAVQLDDLVRPVLATKFRLGLFENPYADANATTHADMLASHRALARTAAARSAVLLRNEGDLLPLAKSARHIAVIGPMAANSFDMLGPWSLTARPEDAVTVTQGLRRKLPNTIVESAEGVQIFKEIPSTFDSMLGPSPVPSKWTAIEAAQHRREALDMAGRSDIVVMALGEHALMDFEYASRSSLRLPGEQQQLLEDVTRLGKPVVLLLFTTRPLELGWASEHVPAILDCYFGGTESGNAIADLLTGDAVPGGKLPVTWPRNVGQVPVFYAHNLSHKPYDLATTESRYWDLPTTPQYPFGYGLSYSTFTITDLRLSTKTIARQGSLNATVTVTNTGKVTADEVVQLYLHQRYGSASRPVRELKGFRRITLKPGESKDLNLPIRAAERTYWSGTKHGWTLDPSDFDVWVGNSSLATLHDTFTVMR
jgi:beta-glucosidase